MSGPDNVAYIWEITIFWVLQCYLDANGLKKNCVLRKEFKANFSLLFLSWTFFKLFEMNTFRNFQSTRLCRIWTSHLQNCRATGMSRSSQMSIRWLKIWPIQDLNLSNRLKRQTSSGRNTIWKISSEMKMCFVNSIKYLLCNRLTNNIFIMSFSILEGTNVEIQLPLRKFLVSSVQLVDVRKDIRSPNTCSNTHE